MERVWNSVIICIKKHTDTYRHKSREIERVDFIDHVPIEEKRRQIRLGSFMNGRDAMSYAFTELPIQTGCCSVITSFLFMTIFFFYKCTCDFSGSTADWRPQLDARFPSNSGDCWTHEMMGDTSAGVLPPPTFAPVGGGVTIKDPPIHQTINLATIYLATTI